jgi:hypothetical protein
VRCPCFQHLLLIPYVRRIVHWRGVFFWLAQDVLTRHVPRSRRRGFSKVRGDQLRANHAVTFRSSPCVGSFLAAVPLLHPPGRSTTRLMKGLASDGGLGSSRGFVGQTLTVCSVMAQSTSHASASTRAGQRCTDAHGLRNTNAHENLIEVLGGAVVRPASNGDLRAAHPLATVHMSRLTWHPSWTVFSLVEATAS